MDRLKGEARVLAGKIEGNHYKVDEGRRMKNGEL